MFEFLQAHPIMVIYTGLVIALALLFHVKLQTIWAKRGAEFAQIEHRLRADARIFQAKAVALEQKLMDKERELAAYKFNAGAPGTAQPAAGPFPPAGQTAQTVLGAGTRPKV